MHRFITLIPVFLVVLSAALNAHSQSSRPNIILIYADDLGYNETGVYGQTKINTPNIDIMAAAGARFTDFYTGSPVCAPARCIMLTGRHSGHSYIRGNYELGGFEDAHEGGQMPLAEGTFTLAHLLKQYGYTTGAIGKWGLGIYGSSGSPDKMGFDYFYGYLDQKQAHNHYPTHLWENGKWDSLNNREIDVHRTLSSSENHPDSFKVFTGNDYAPEKEILKAKDFLGKNKSKSFFLYLPFTLPHLSLQIPAEKLKQYQASFKDEQPYRGQNGYASTLYPYSTYAAMISYLDSMVGVIFASLKENSLLNNTIVLFTSDNAATFNTGGFNREIFGSNLPLRGGKQDLYEGGIRVPMIAWWPGRISPGKIIESTASQVDMLSTIADLLKVKAEKSDGLSFLPLLVGKVSSPKERSFYFEFPEKGGQVAVRLGKWKGVKRNMKANPGTIWELYDLSRDISETTDLAKDHPEILRQFDAIVKKEHQHSHIKEWEFVDAKF
ncbi:arylsulfatase [Pollutibacter soli]|uniref:arylsulfatase n=1 Tax=Pollutibacter soli TaxID=3034157 RepID=UPI003013973D